VLLVDPRPGRWLFLETAVPELSFHPCSDFVAARGSLLSDPPDLLVTNLRLGAHNGLHLVYLVQEMPRSRVLVYGNVVDLPLILEAQTLGAFFETPDRVLGAVRSFVRSQWPPRDRRVPREFDRRRECRGGRRVSDAGGVRGPRLSDFSTSNV
jgi:hypothetical protein